jgi:hypothetical protein
MAAGEVPGGPGDRRAFFRESIGRGVEGMVEAAEDRVVQKRNLRPPGALPQVGFLAASTRCGECLPVCKFAGGTTFHRRSFVCKLRWWGP